MFKKYYLIHAIINGVNVNSYTDRSIADWIVSCSKKGINAIIVNYWSISKKEYETLKIATNTKVIE